MILIVVELNKLYRDLIDNLLNIYDIEKFLPHTDMILAHNI